MTADPKIWILSGGRKGDLDQMLVLARAMGWPYEVKHIAQGTAPPWPDLVLCAEAKASVLARRIKRLSAGRTRLVCLGRPAGTARNFDLVITTPQYRIPAAPNVVEATSTWVEPASICESSLFSARRACCTRASSF